MAGDDLAREFDYRGPHGRFALDGDVQVREAVGVGWRDREREAAELVGDSERVAWLDGLAPEAVYAHCRAANDARGPDAFFAGHAPHAWDFEYRHALRDARREVDRQRRDPVREPTPEDRAMRQSLRDASRAVYLGMPPGWVPPDRVRARRRVVADGRVYQAGGDRAGGFVSAARNLRVAEDPRC